MSRGTKPIPLDNSEAVQPPGSRVVRKTRGGQRLRVTFVLRSSALPPGHPVAKKVKRILSSVSHRRPVLSRKEYEEYLCADARHVEAVKRFARAHGLDVVAVSGVRHDVVVEGKASALEKAFHVDLYHFIHDKGGYRGHKGPVHLPAELRESVRGVLGLDDLVYVNKPHPPRALFKPPGLTFSVPRLADYYCFPPGTTGDGQRVALIEFAGGYHPTDIEAYFKKLRIRRPEISDKCVHRALGEPLARNDPLDPESIRKILKALKANPGKVHKKYGSQLDSLRNTIEVTMDLEIAGSLAPGAKFVVIFAPGTGRGLYDALHMAMAEEATVISLSWGFLECALPGHQVHSINRVLHDAAVRGITVCCASGDDGSRATGGDRPNGVANVNFPASSPYVLACGGTGMRRAGDRIEGEIVWNNSLHGIRLATGGGVSGWFVLPSYQRRANVPRCNRSAPRKTWLSREMSLVEGFRGRGVPDVAANADFDTAYEIIVGGVQYHGFGTSAAAPLWAALIARLNEGLGRRLGWLNRDLYHPNVARTFRRITRGNNDVCEGRLLYYRAGRRWCGCTGLGTPDGSRLLGALRGERG
jgi:kumamolisin